LKRGDILAGLDPGILHNIVGVGSAGRHSEDVGAQLGSDLFEFGSNIHRHRKSVVGGKSTRCKKKSVLNF